MSTARLVGIAVLLLLAGYGAHELIFRSAGSSAFAPVYGGPNGRIMRRPPYAGRFRLNAPATLPPATPGSAQDFANKPAEFGLAGPLGSTPVTRIFRVKKKQASMIVPDGFAPRVREMFSAYPGGVENLDFIQRQTVVTTYNLWTEEYSMFNEVRRYRPGFREKLPEETLRQIDENWESTRGADKCDFCGNRTAVELFGRIDGKHCYVASNVAKYERWHALLVAHEHHPLRYTLDGIVDALATARKWFELANGRDPEARFPHLMWDAGSRASASQPHLHMQLSLSHNAYFTRAEHTRLSAWAYAEAHPGHNYWADVVAAHETLGLAVRRGDCAVLSYVTPIKEREVIVVGPSAYDRCFGELFYAALAALRDGLHTRAFSAAVLPEPLGKNPTTSPVAGQEEPMTAEDALRRSFLERNRGARYPYPALARIVDRGVPGDVRSDVGAMEFFGANNVAADPWATMPHLRREVEKLR